MLCVGTIAQSSSLLSQIDTASRLWDKMGLVGSGPSSKSSLARRSVTVCEAAAGEDGIEAESERVCRRGADGNRARRWTCRSLWMLAAKLLEARAKTRSIRLLRAQGDRSPKI